MQRKREEGSEEGGAVAVRLTNFKQRAPMSASEVGEGRKVTNELLSKVPAFCLRTDVGAFCQWGG